MRIMVIGGTGMIGKEVVKALAPRHEVVPVTRNSTAVRANIEDPASLDRLFQEVGRLDAVVVAAGTGAFGGIEELTDADFELGLRSKLMGQVNVVRRGISHLNDGGSFTLTTGVLARHPTADSITLTLVNCAVEGFARAVAVDAPRGIRINVVSPGWVAETLKQMGRDPSIGTPSAVVARAYLEAVEGKGTGTVIPVPSER